MISSEVMSIFSEAEGHCYIETSNLDGESNLKIRQVKTLVWMYTMVDPLMHFCYSHTQKQWE